LSVRRFCEREGLGTASFYRWRSLLEAKPERRKTLRPRVEGMAPVAGPGFLDLGSVEAAGNEVVRMEVRLELGDGLVLKLIRS
jgi:hypothetical protein